MTGRIELKSQSPDAAAVAIDGKLVGRVQRHFTVWSFVYWTRQVFHVCDVNEDFIPDPNRVGEVPAYVRQRLQTMFDEQEIHV